MIPPELERTLGKFAESKFCDLVKGVFIYRNSVSDELVMMLREGTEWVAVTRCPSNDPVKILVICRRLAIDILAAS